MPALWPFRPDGGVLERYGWLTSVLEGATLVEQRAAQRRLPRQDWRLDYVLSGAEQRTAENILHGNRDGTLYLPVWMDAQAIGYSAPASADEIFCQTSYRDLSAGRLVALIDPDNPLRNEIATVESVDPDNLVELDGVLADDWDPRTLLVPVRECILTPAQDLARFTGSVIHFRSRFTAIDYREHDAASETTYRDYPVLMRRPNWIQDPEQSIGSNLREVDSGVGVPYRRDPAGPVRSHRMLWTLLGRQDIDDYLGWLYARRGRLAAFWMPSFAQDLEIVTAIGAADTTLDVAHCGYTAHVAQALGRRDIQIETRAGVTYRRRITASTVIDDTTERLTIDAALGADVAAADVALVTFMHLARLENDAIELAWWDWQTVDSRVTSKGIRNAV